MSDRESEELRSGASRLRNSGGFRHSARSSIVRDDSRSSGSGCAPGGRADQSRDPQPAARRSGRSGTLPGGHRRPWASACPSADQATQPGRLPTRFPASVATSGRRAAVRGGTDAPTGRRISAPGEGCRCSRQGPWFARAQARTHPQPPRRRPDKPPKTSRLAARHASGSAGAEAALNRPRRPTSLAQLHLRAPASVLREPGLNEPVGPRAPGPDSRSRGPAGAAQAAAAPQR